MSPSSLIFVVVIAIWATYFSVYVMRRREQLSTARSVDRFSTHMRILQRRSVKAVPRPEPLTSSGNARTSILAAGALVQSRAATSGASSATARPRLEGSVGAPPVVSPAAREQGGYFASLVGRADWTAGSAVATGVARWADETSLRVASLGRGRATRRAARRGRPAGRGAAVRPNRTFAAWGALTGLTGRQVRAIALLVGLGVVLVTFPLAVLGQVAWPVPAAATLCTIGLLTALRLDRRAVEAASRRRETAALIEVERMEAEEDRREALLKAEREALVDRADQDQDVIDDTLIGPRRGVGPAAGRRAPVSSPDIPFDVSLFDPAPVSAAGKRVVRGEGYEHTQDVAVGRLDEGLHGALDQEPIPVPLDAASPWEFDADELTSRLDPNDPLVVERSWAPVPVPVPTYALKARAQRPVAAPEVPVPIEVEDDFDDVLWTPSQKVVNG